MHLSMFTPYFGFPANPAPLSCASLWKLPRSPRSRFSSTVPGAVRHAIPAVGCIHSVPYSCALCGILPGDVAVAARPFCRVPFGGCPCPDNGLRSTPSCAVVSSVAFPRAGFRITGHPADGKPPPRLPADFTATRGQGRLSTVLDGGAPRRMMTLYARGAPPVNNKFPENPILHTFQHTKNLYGTRKNQP